MLKGLVHAAMRAGGFDIVRYPLPREGPDISDLSPKDCDVIRRLTGYTMTSTERKVALIQAVRHLVRQGIEGCFVECGVWRGGSMIGVALTLTQEGETSRELYLYDTFEGMTPPMDVDRDVRGVLAQVRLDHEREYWCIADLDDVEKNMASTGYPKERVHFVKGPLKPLSQNTPQLNLSRSYDSTPTGTNLRAMS